MSEVQERVGAGPLLREWRQRRRLSQLDLALEARVSARHVSFIETGRARPSAEMVLHLAEQLDVPLRDRNQLLLAAGHAPAYGQRSLDEPELEPVRAALERVLEGHAPNPAIVVDCHWGMVAANAGIAPLIAGAAPHLLEPPVNVLRLSLHPRGVAPRIVNLAQWRAHLLERLRRQIALTGDSSLATLLEECSSYPGPESGAEDSDEIAVPLRLRSPAGQLNFISTVSTFGTAVEVTTSELSIESFFPADDATATALREYV